MNLLWTELALADLAALYEHISADNVVAADQMLNRIVLLAEAQLSRMPESGRLGRVPNTRELVVTGSPYFLPYRIVGETIQVLRVIHGACRWPEKQ
ncbi:MAG TPA: type II toxin-antitoxin system RelE/ParE family toxin [Xanthobacteraceae bacterium]|jgi:plasmid stabilization system protein ParE